MDIFSVANKQVTQPGIETSTNIRKTVTPSAKIEKNIVPSKNELKNTIEHLNKHMEDLDTNVKFGFNDKVEHMFVNVMERSTGKIIRKIPTEEAMKISEKMKEIVGMIFDKKG